MDKPDPPSPIRKLRARMAFKAFTGHDPTGEYVAELDRRSQAAYRLGTLIGVAYEAKRDGKVQRYFHEYAKTARPDLAVRDDGRQLYVVGGKYRVTDRGIEDMPALFVVNPSSRRAKRKSKGTAPMAAKRRRSPRRNSKGRFTKTAYAANPAPSRRKGAARKRRAPGVVIVQRNPIKRRRGVRRARGFRRNPIGGVGFSVSGLLMPAAMIGAGAVGAEIVMGYLPIPASFKTGYMRYATKGAVAVAAGWGVAKFVNKRAGEALALGGLAISVHEAIKHGLSTALPSVKMGGYLPRYRGQPGVGAYVQRLGYYSPGRPVMAGRASDGPMGAYVPAMAGRASDGFDQSPVGNFGC